MEQVFQEIVSNRESRQWERSLSRREFLDELDDLGPKRKSTKTEWEWNDVGEYVRPREQKSIKFKLPPDPPPSNIIENIWVMNLRDAMAWKGPRLCVIEDKSWCKLKKADDYWAPILAHAPSGGLLGAPVKNLDAAAKKLEEIRKTGQPVAVNCFQGMERSPLTVAWWLHKYRNMSIPDAYKLLKSKRDIVLNRENWIIGDKEKERPSEEKEREKWREFKKWLAERKA